MTGSARETLRRCLVSPAPHRRAPVPRTRDVDCPTVAAHRFTIGALTMLSRILHRTAPAAANTCRTAQARRRRRAWAPFPEQLENRALLAIGDLDLTYGNGGTAAVAVDAPVDSNPSVVLTESGGKIITVGSYLDQTAGFPFGEAV